MNFPFQLSSYNSNEVLYEALNVSRGIASSFTRVHERAPGRRTSVLFGAGGPRSEAFARFFVVTELPSALWLTVVF